MGRPPRNAARASLTAWAASLFGLPLVCLEQRRGEGGGGLGAGTGGPAGPAPGEHSSAARPRPRPLALGIVRGVLLPSRQGPERERSPRKPDGHRPERPPLKNPKYPPNTCWHPPVTISTARPECLACPPDHPSVLREALNNGRTANSPVQDVRQTDTSNSDRLASPGSAPHPQPAYVPPSHEEVSRAWSAPIPGPKLE